MTTRRRRGAKASGSRSTLDADSLLHQAARNLPSTLLAWHYRSRYESLISFSNAAFYGGNLFTIPDRSVPGSALAEIAVPPARSAQRPHAHADALLARPISFHCLDDGALRRIAAIPARRPTSRELVRELLRARPGCSIGIVAFSEAQQGEIESALEQLAADDDSAVRRAARGRI